MRTRYDGPPGISIWLGFIAVAFTLGFVAVAAFLIVQVITR